MKSNRHLLLSLSLLLILFACDEAPFRTPLQDIATIIGEVPEGYTGTFLLANDSIRAAAQKSGLSTEAFVAEHLVKEGWNMEQKIYSVYTTPNRKHVMFTTLIPFAASKIDSGTYTNGDQTIRWHRILDHALEIRVTDTNQDTTFQSPVWKSGELYFMPESVFSESAGASMVDGYELVSILADRPAEKGRWGLTPGLLKEHSGDHYLILRRDDGFYQVNQYRLTAYGFERSNLREVRTSEEPTDAEMESFLKDLKTFREATPADTLERMIVLDPSGHHLNKLFRSSFAHTDHFMRLNVEEPAYHFPDSFAITLGAFALALLIYIIVKGRRKASS